MCVIRDMLATQGLIVVMLLVNTTLVLSVTVPVASVNANRCTDNCGRVGVVGNDHTVVKKETVNKLSNSTEDTEKMFEEYYFDALAGLISPEKVKQNGAENRIESTSREARLLEDPQSSDAFDDYSLDDDSNEFTARNPRQRKIWMAALAGIVLKLASLLPLILGKLALMGTTALLASKLSLLLVGIIVLKSMFSSDKGGHSNYPEAGFTSNGNQHAYQQEYPQGVTGYQGMQANPNHRRWAYYRGVGREMRSWEDELKNKN